MEEKQIKAVHNCLKLQSICNIQDFLEFPNFYWRFIQGFNRPTASLTSTLNTISAADPAMSVKVEDQENDGKGIQVEN